MNLKLTLQIFILLIIILISSAFYYGFFVAPENNKQVAESEAINFDKNIIDKKIYNELLNIEYNSTDEHGNTFYINAENASIKPDSGNENIILMSKVISIINLKEKGLINIFAENATYNKINHDTFFSNKVRIEYLDNKIYSENLDLLFTEKISKIYNDVVFNNNNINLSTDKILFNMITGNIQLKMNNNNDTVKLIAKNEFIN